MRNSLTGYLEMGARTSDSSRFFKTLKMELASGGKQSLELILGASDMDSVWCFQLRENLVSEWSIFEICKSSGGMTGTHESSYVIHMDEYLIKLQKVKDCLEFMYYCSKERKFVWFGRNIPNFWMLVAIIKQVTKIIFEWDHL